MIRFDLVFHLGLDLFEIIGRDAVWKIHIVIKAVLHRRPCGELRFRPDFQNRCRKYVRRRMTKTFDIRHCRALL